MENDNKRTEDWLDYYMEGELSEGDWAMINTRIQEDPAFAKQFALDLAILKGVEKVGSVPVVKPNPVRLEKKVFYKKWEMAALAASLAFIFAIGYAWWISHEKYKILELKNSELATQKDELSKEKEELETKNAQLSLDLKKDKTQSIPNPKGIVAQIIPSDVVNDLKVFTLNAFKEDAKKNLRKAGTGNSSWKSALLNDSLKQAQAYLEQVQLDKKGDIFYQSALYILNNDRAKLPAAIASMKDLKDVKLKLAPTLLLLVYLEQGDIKSAKAELKEVKTNGIDLALPPSVLKVLE
jgi:hypothetical protein